jgi:hypothetical protein
MAVSAAVMPRDVMHLYPTALIWVPAAAFCGAALSCWKLVTPWVSFVALGLNVASLLLFFLAAYASATDPRVGLVGFAYALPAAALAGWNLVHGSGEHAGD